MPRHPRKRSPGHVVDELQRTTAALEAVLRDLEVQRAEVRKTLEECRAELQRLKDLRRTLRGPQSN